MAKIVRFPFISHLSCMKVFGIGLNKTGTSTLGHALRILGFKQHVGPRTDLLQQWAAGNIEPIIDAAKHFNNFEDWPWPLVYKELYQQFPNAKFILTIRSSPDVWFRSLCKHSERTGPTKQREWVYGHALPDQHQEEHIAFYEKHNAEVIRFFEDQAPDKLLVINWTDGDNWAKLCGFLHTELPSVPFPHIKPLEENNRQWKSPAGRMEKLKNRFRNKK